MQWFYLNLNSFQVLVLDAEDANKMADMDVVGPQNADDQAFEISAIGDTKDKCTSAEDNQEDLSMLEAFPHNPVLPLYSSTPIVEKNMRAQILSRNLVRGEDGELFAANKMDEQQTMPSFQDDSIQPEEVRSPSSPRPRSLTTEKQRCDESQAWTSINARSPVDDVPSGKTGLNGSKLLGKRKSKKFIYPSANERSSSPQTINMSSLSHSFSKASQPINKEFKTNEEIDTVSHPIHSLLFTCGNNDLPLIKTSIKPQSDFKSLSNLTSKNDTSNTLGHDTKEHSCLEKSSKNAELTSVSNHDKLKSENDKEMNKNEVALSRFKKDYFEDTEFVGFRSASGKRIAISDEALVKGRTLWDNANENVSENSTAELNHQENDAENNYQNVLNESSDKAFSDNVVEYSSKDCTNLPIKSLQEDIEYENKERMELAGKSPEDFTKTDQSRESFTKTNQSHEESMKIANEFPSFKTASNKQIDIKPELLVKARNLWHQIETCESEIKEVPRATFGSVKSKELLDPKHEGLKESPRSDISPILGSQKFKRKGNKLSLQNPSKPLLSEHPKSLSFSFPSEKRELSLGSSRKFRKHSQSLNHPEMKERRERSPTCGQALAISEKRCDSQEKMEINDITEAFLLDLSWDNVLNERQSLNKNRQI